MQDNLFASKITANLPKGTEAATAGAAVATIHTERSRRPAFSRHIPYHITAARKLRPEAQARTEPDCYPRYRTYYRRRGAAWKSGGFFYLCGLSKII